jgi:hypothetical protein
MVDASGDASGLVIVALIVEVEWSDLKYVGSCR